MSDIAARAAALAGGDLAQARRLSGGNLSQVLALRLADGRDLVAKHGPHARIEADMLAAIAATGAPAPAVVGVDDEILVMAAVAADGRLEGGACKSDGWTALAAALGALHRPREKPYGWPVDHAFGPVAIANGRTDDWPRFWGERRLRCHIPHVDAGIGEKLAGLADRLADLLPARPPAALLHGDLWGGNVLVCGGRITALIDPACCYGDREVDIAMLTLFDAPPQSFLDALALPPGWRARLPIYQLWPLLVHLRLFGGGYRARVLEALGRVGV